MNEVESQLNDLALGMTKAVLRAENLEDFHNDSAALYQYLSEYFRMKSEEQSYADSIAVSEDVARAVMNTICIPKFAAVEGKFQSFDTSIGPFVSQKVLKEELSTIKFNTTALADILEVCRYLDFLQKSTTPFGAVNVIHFGAVAMSLASIPLLRLLEVLWDATEGFEKLRLAVVHLWALLDAQNRPAYETIVNATLDRPGLTFPLLLDLHPQVKDINTTRFSALVVQKEPHIVSYTDEDTVRQQKPTDNDLDTDDSMSGDDSAVDREFWTALVN